MDLKKTEYNQQWWWQYNQQ
jgi:hypothetical protein